jgi:16S rRNA (uracil1498-N3)-methyltransferase
MNIVLFEADELTQILQADDPRARHLVHTLKRTVGDSFDAAEIDGKRGKGVIRGIDESGIQIDFELTVDTPPLYPVRLIVGLIRPVHAKRILKEAATLGVESIDFVVAEKTEASYAQSSLWKDDNRRSFLIEGAAQAFSTRLPATAIHQNLYSCLSGLSPGFHKAALDNYEAAGPISRFDPRGGPCALAVGPERGWSDGERRLLEKEGFVLYGMGQRVQKTETACISGLAIIINKLGAW